MDNPDNMHLFKPLTMGHIELRNRVVMAPMTRARADHESHLPIPYYLGGEKGYVDYPKYQWMLFTITTNTK